MNPFAFIGRLKSVYDIGKAIRNHIYTRRNFKLLLKKHYVMLYQLERANRILSRSKNTDAKNYCRDYSIPTDEVEVKIH